MAGLNDAKSSNTLKTILDAEGNNILLSNGISSLNFNGNIPKISALKVVSEIKVGDIVSDSEFSQANTSHLISRINIKNLMGSDNITQTLYFLYYISDTEGERQLIFSSDFLDDSYLETEYYGGYSSLKQLYVLSDNLSRIDLGTDGWFISNSGNAVFSNGFFRGRIEATEGRFSGKVYAGDKDASVTIGKNLFSGFEFIDSDTITDINPTGTISIPSGTEAHGLLIDNNNYFFTFSGDTPSNITQITTSDSSKDEYEYSATFTYTKPSLTFDATNRIDRYANIDISGIVDTSTNTDLATLNRSFAVSNTPIDGTVFRSGTTATINCTAHGLSAGDTVEISGLLDNNYPLNGFWIVSSTGLTSNSFQITTTDSGDIAEIKSSQTVTITNGIETKATTSTAHGLSNGDSIKFTTTNTLPTGMNITTTYYVIDRTDYDFYISDQYNGVAITTTSSGSGTHSVNALNIDVGGALTRGATLTKDGKFTVKLQSEITQYGSSYPITINLPSGSVANNAVLSEELILTSVILNKKTITKNLSSTKVYTTAATNYIAGEKITFTNFGTYGTVNLSLLNDTFLITDVSSTYLTVETTRINANTYLFSSNYPYISNIGQIAKFKVGNGTSYMKYDSSLDSGAGRLEVSGKVTATTGTIGGWAIDTSSLTAGNMDSSGNGIQFVSGTDPYIKINNAPSLTYNDLLIRYGGIAAPDFGNTKINDSRGEIIFWKNTSTNPNRITMRRFAEATIPFIATISQGTPAIIQPAIYTKLVNFSVSSGKTITLSDTNNLSIGMKLTGTNIPSNTYITDIPSGVTIPEITISNDITSTVSSGTILTFSYSYSNGIRVYLSTSGTLPGGLVASPNVIYYIVGSTSSTFNLSSSEGGAAINTSTAGSGVHTINFKEADGLAYMDMTSNAIGGTPDFAEINLSVSRSDGIDPSSIDYANIYISQGIADTNNTTKPATVKLNATNNSISNSLLITANNPARFYDSSNNNTFTTHPADGSGFSNSSSGTTTGTAYLNRYYSEGTNLTTTSTTYTQGSTVCGFVFKTGITGKISVTVGGLIQAGADANLSGLSYEIYRGTDTSGTRVVTASDNYGFLNYNTQNVQGSMNTLISLDANTTYYIRTMHRTSSASVTAYIYFRSLTVLSLN